MSWKLFKFERRPARRRPIRRSTLLRLEALEARVVPSTDVTAYHQASPVPSPSSTIGAGVNSNETILTPANVNSTDFGKLFSTTVDGQVYAEPLYMENVNITTGTNQGTHNVVFVATQHDSLYAIDANTGTILWQDPLLTAEHSGTVRSVPNSAVGSNDISPEIGVTATPVIDPATNTIFVEAKEQEVASDGTHFEHHLYAINIGSGAITNETLIADSIGDTVISGPSAEGNGDGSSGGVLQFDALRQMDRPALSLVNGNIYLAFASHGDNTPYHGWILGYSESALALTAVFNANPNGFDDGIWQGGGTLAYETVNGNTFLYFETGNGSFDTTLTASPFTSGLMIPNQGDYGDSFVKVEIDGSTPAAGSLNAANNMNGWGMHVADYFTPMNEGNLSNGDTDLGSGAPLLLPASAGSAAHPNLMVGSGKEGRIYLIDRDNMGGYHGDAAGDGNSGTDNIVQETGYGTINGSLDTPTFFNGVLYYVGGYGDQARTFTVANAAISSTSVSQSTDSYPFPGSTATISTNTSGGNAVVWDIAGPGTNELRAYDASQGYNSEIYTSDQAANSRDALGSAVKFTVPTVADGEVFVGTTNSVVAYSLLQPATAAPAAPSNLSASAFSGSVINLAWTDNDTPPNSATGYNIYLSKDGKNFTQVGTASAGAASFAVGGLQVSTKYYFEINAFNSVGTSAFSNIANATTTSQAGTLDFSSGFAGSSGVLTYNGSATINGTSAELTDGGGFEAGSVFSTNAVDVTNFSNQFTFQLTNASADGFTFTIQGDGPTELGATGGDLGYGGIPNSVAVKFDLYDNAGEGTDSTGEYTDGASPFTPAIDLSGTGIDLHSGDVFQVAMGYDGTTLNVTITDTSTKASASQSYTVNIPQVIGSNIGYVGFTGGTGGLAAVQDIQTWDYAPTATTLPAAPSNLTGTVVSGSEIDISWTNNATNATSILIDRSTDGVHFSQIASVSATVTTYHDTSLNPGKTYYYEVAASNAAGTSAFSNVFQASTLTAPAPPTNLAATKITTTEVDLSWTNVATNASGIKILKQLGNNSPQVVATGLAPTTTSYDITSLTAGSPYIFEVDALNSNGPSGAATIKADTLPSQVTGVTATGGTGQVTISWAADQGAVTYNVYRATQAGGEGSTPYVTGVAGTSFTDVAVSAGTTYYYEVTAVDPNAVSPTDLTAESAKSAEVSAAAQSGTSNVLGAPTSLAATVQTGPLVQLTWNNNSPSATGFTIERATNAVFTQNVTTFSAPAASTATVTFTDRSTIANTTYYYRVQAVKGTATTAFSNSVTVAIPLPNNQFIDPGFESPNVGTGSRSDFAYNPSGAQWTYSSSSGVAGNSSGFTGHNPNAPQGTQVAFLQKTGTISQVVNFTAGTYAISFYAAQRANQVSTQKIEVEVDSTVVGTFTPSGTSYNLYTSKSFTVTAGTHTVQFIGLDPNGGDNTALIDQANIQQPATNQFNDPGFESPNVGTGSRSDFFYNPSGAPWTYISTSGVAGNGSGFTGYNPNAPQGTQVTFLQEFGSISQVVNFTAGTYAISFYAAQRAGQASSQKFEVEVDGKVVGTFTPSGTSYDLYTTTRFTVTAGTHTVQFIGLDPKGGDNTAFIDQANIQQPATNQFNDPGFETPNVGTGSRSDFIYNPSGASWVYGNSSGVAGNGSSLTGGNPNAPQGTQVAFLQDYGSISQVVNFTAGTYAVSFDAAQRAGQASSQTFEVEVDGKVVGTFTPSGTSYNVYTTNNFTVTAGTHTLSFIGLDPNGGDNTALIDQASI
jgi:fibronectin type 3 domain-containing protein